MWRRAGGKVVMGFGGGRGVACLVGLGRGVEGFERGGGGKRFGCGAGAGGRSRIRVEGSYSPSSRSVGGGLEGVGGRGWV